jgi:hypothetical protein
MLSSTLNSERAIQVNLPNSQSDDWFQFSKPAPLNFSEKRSEANLTRVAELKCLPCEICGATAMPISPGSASVRVSLRLIDRKAQTKNRLC